MATKSVYIASGIAFAAAVLGFAGYKSIEARKSNDDQLLVATGSGGVLGNSSSQNAESGLPSGNSIGDGGGMGTGPGNQPNSGSPMNGFQRGGRGGGNNIDVRPSEPGGNGSGATGNGGRRPREDGGGQVRPGAGNNPGGQSGGFGQAAPGEMDYFGTGAMILADAKVQTELKLSAAQKAAVKQALEPPKAADNTDEMGAQVQNYLSRSAEQGKKVKAILDDNQEKRYMQLVHQQMGPVMLMNNSAKEKFGISEEESKKMIEIMTSFSAEFQKGMSGGQMPNLDAIAKVKAEMDKKVLAVLDEDSRSKWNAATGTPFTFSSPMGLGGMMGGMGRGGGGRRSGGN